MSDYIPSELIRNILARLPVDDVVRCTSVCKSWYSLITCPSFASLHRNLSAPNQEPQLLIQSYKSEDNREHYYLHRDDQSFDEVAELDPPFHHKWGIIDSLNGLVCLYDTEDRIVLWNPSLRKSLILPKPRVLSEYLINTVGFGFVPTRNEYKIIRLSYTNGPKREAQIYELSAGSWRDLKLEDDSYPRGLCSQAHLNGVIHWYGFNPSYSKLISSFDLKNEKFGTLLVPSCLRHDEVLFCSAYTFRESLCLVHYAYGGRSVNIWIMKEYGIADSWEKLFSIDTEQHTPKHPLYFRHNGDLLFGKVYTTPTERLELVSYNCNSNQVKNVGLLGNRPPTEYPFMICAPFMIRTYVESLVLLKVPNEVEIDQDSTEISKNV